MSRNDYNRLIDHIRDEVLSKPPCENGKHWFVPYNEGNMICEKCGRFAKVGRLYRNPNDNKV